MKTNSFFLLLTLSFTLFNIQHCFSQKRYLFRTYTTRDGLINNTIFSINQNKKGYIWFGTDAGVSKFNGYSFNNKVIPVINENESFCQHIDKDYKGNLVFSTFMQGVVVEQENDRYKQFFVTKYSVGKNVIRTTRACPDGRLLVSLSWSLLVLEKDTFRTLYNSVSDRKIVNSLEYDTKNNIWFGGYGGLNVIFSNDTSHTPYFIPEFKDKIISKILFDDQQNLLVGTKFGLYKITFTNLTDGKLEYSVNKPIEELNDASINHIYIDRQRNIWISTTTMGVFKTKHNKIIENISYSNGLPSTSIMCVFQDSENNYWFGTPDGVCKLISFSNYSFSFEDKPVIGIGQIEKDKFDRLWLWDGTTLLISKDEKISRANIKETRFEKEDIKSIYLTDSDVYFFNPYGLYKMPLTEELNFSRMKRIADFIKADVSRMRCYMMDDLGILWIGFEEGLYAYRNNKLFKCKIRSEKELNLRPTQIVKDNYGYYWIGDFSYGLYRMRLDNTTRDQVIMDSVISYKSMKADSSFITVWVQDMILDHKNNLWMSTLYTGVYKLQLSNKGVVSAHLYATRNGLSSNNVTQLVEDKKHNIWFATQNGADRLVPQEEGKEEFFTHYNSKKGLGITVYDILPDENIAYISFAEGFYAVDINHNAIEKIPPKVTITDVLVMGKTDSLALQSKDAYRLRYNQNFIAFDFASISFTHENGILYQYRLNGIDKSWSAYSDRRFVNYNSLPPGKYTFQVRSKTAHDLNDSGITEFKFLIFPPFYKTWWFIAVCFILIVSVVYFAYQYRIKQLLKLERLRVRIASDLHDDVGSTLSSISILSELLQAQLDNSPRATEMIQKIGSNARNMLESMDDIIWAVNPSNDKFQNLGLRIREYAIPLFESKDIKFSITTPEQLGSLPIPMHIRRNVYLICKEAVNNLIKYSACTEAKIEFKESHSLLTMNITDNGKGFDTEILSLRNGLRNMKRRAEQIGATVAINSEVGKGTHIQLSIKII